MPWTIWPESSKFRRGAWSAAEDALTEFYEEAIEAEVERVEEMGDGKAKQAAYAALASLRANVVQRDRMRLDARWRLRRKRTR
jgi:hypothetical protein